MTNNCLICGKKSVKDILNLKSFTTSDDIIIQSSGEYVFNVKIILDPRSIHENEVKNVFKLHICDNCFLKNKFDIVRLVGKIIRIEGINFKSQYNSEFLLKDKIKEFQIFKKFLHDAGSFMHKIGFNYSIINNRSSFEQYKYVRMNQNIVEYNNLIKYIPEDKLKLIYNTYTFVTHIYVKREVSSFQCSGYSIDGKYYERHIFKLAFLQQQANTDQLLLKKIVNLESISNRNKKTIKYLRNNIDDFKQNSFNHLKNTQSLSSKTIDIKSNLYKYNDDIHFLSSKIKEFESKTDILDKKYKFVLSLIFLQILCFAIWIAKSNSLTYA